MLCFQHSSHIATIPCSGGILQFNSTQCIFTLVCELLTTTLLIFSCKERMISMNARGQNWRPFFCQLKLDCLKNDLLPSALLPTFWFCFIVFNVTKLSGRVVHSQLSESLPCHTCIRLLDKMNFGRGPGCLVSPIPLVSPSFWEESL